MRDTRSPRARDPYVTFKNVVGLGALAILIVMFGMYEQSKAAKRAEPPQPPPTVAVPAYDQSPAPLYEPLSPTPQEWANDARPGERVTVERIIDGDTFVTGDGDHVRVLGIDSCEAGTDGGRRATERAEDLLRSAGTVVTVTREPGVDRDRYDRALRYVQHDGADFGEDMVAFDHTEVYQGRNDASPEYLDRLREADLDAVRDCAGNAVSNYVAPRFKSGGDDDGESRFCRKRRWC